MNDRIKEKVLEITKRLRDVPDSRCRHFTFIIHKNRILSLGWNNSWKTHSWSKEMGHRFSCIHSEVSAILRYRGSKRKLRKCVLVNTRINRFGEFGMSKPCDICDHMISQIGFKEVYYTNQNGEWLNYKHK